MFRPLAADDIPLLHRWLNNPLVAEWYGLGVENIPFPALEQVETNYLPRVRGEKPTYCYIMCLGEREFGYVQTYRSAATRSTRTRSTSTATPGASTSSSARTTVRDRGLGHGSAAPLR